MTDTVLTIAGFCLAVAGIGILWGVGFALLAAGVVLFMAGGLASRKGP